MKDKIFGISMIIGVLIMGLLGAITLALIPAIPIIAIVWVVHKLFF